MSKQWFPHYPGDYMRQTGHLSLVEDGAYRRLLDHYYSTGKPLPAKAQQLHRICRAVDDHEREAVDYVVSEFFEKKGSLLHNSRADEELLKSHELSLKRSNAAKKRKPAKAGAIAGAIADTATATATTTSITKESLRSQGVGDEYVDDVFQIMTMADEFAKVQTGSIAGLIKIGRLNPRYKTNMQELSVDAINAQGIGNATGMIRSYLARVDKGTGQSQPRVESTIL